ncbi:YifB family Mg chelatase-like AAA ATPase [Candidatus Parcubacteria bacterium]|nr:YifB family Mg chelatase-like AAA ATPase [Candidatus Parcubacteria bacterium]
MSFSRVYSAQPYLLKGALVTIETDLSSGSLHAFNIVGLGDKAVDEAKDRVSSAIKNSNYKSPKKENMKIVVSLSPADMKKEGSYFDLGIAIGYLLAHEDIYFETDGKLFIGELALDGTIKPLRGVLPLVEAAKQNGFKEIFVPKENALEAALVDDINVYGAYSLEEVINHLDQGKSELYIPVQPKTNISFESQESTLDFCDVKGQAMAKRGLEIAAAGGHNICMYGPPGTGKTMLAKLFATILPNLSKDEVLEVTGIHSIAGTTGGSLVTQPPFRSPHHTSSYVSLIGGGSTPKPGEVTLAHKGVLFLDEFPEFEKRVLESLRQPLEDRVVTVSRAKGTVVFPTNFILIAAMNPPEKDASFMEKLRQKKKISGPIMDRIDMWVEVSEIDYEKLGSKEKEGEESLAIKNRVKSARDIQKKRFESGKRSVNNEMNVRELHRHAELNEETKQILNKSAEKLSLSARAYHRVIKLARTIADLDKKNTIETNHILEALQYRPKDLFE